MPLRSTSWSRMLIGARLDEGGDIANADNLHLRSHRFGITKMMPTYPSFRMYSATFRTVPNGLTVRAVEPALPCTTTNYSDGFELRGFVTFTPEHSFAEAISRRPASTTSSRKSAPSTGQETQTDSGRYARNLRYLHAVFEQKHHFSGYSPAGVT